MPHKLIVILTLLICPLAIAELTSERLGFSPSDKVLLIHADDIGMSHTVNRATFEAFKKGMVRSGSVMLPCPWVVEIQNRVKQNPNVDLGIHVTLTSEWRHYRWAPLSISPGLTDSLGFMWPSLKDAVKHATPNEVATEVEAQIKRALTLGLNPTHLDSHMGVHFAKPEFLENVISIGKKYGIPPMLMRWSDDLKKEILAYGLDLEPIKRITKKATDEGAVLLDYLVTGVPGKTIKERHRAYDTLLKNIKPGVTQLIVHLGYHDDEMKGIMVDAPEGEYRRYADFLYFTSPKTKELLKKLGIHLIGWKDLKSLAWKTK